MADDNGGRIRYSAPALTGWAVTHPAVQERFDCAAYELASPLGLRLPMCRARFWSFANDFELRAD
jgi:hypothetical protein